MPQNILQRNDGKLHTIHESDVPDNDSKDFIVTASAFQLSPPVAKQLERATNSLSPNTAYTGSTYSSPARSPSYESINSNTDSNCSISKLSFTGHNNVFSVISPGAPTTRKRGKGRSSATTAAAEGLIIVPRDYKKRSSSDQYMCAKCHETLLTRTALRKHLATVHPENIKIKPCQTQKICPVKNCNFSTCKRDQFDQHMKKHLDDGHTPTGKKRLSANEPLKRHR